MLTGQGKRLFEEFSRAEFKPHATKSVKRKNFLRDIKALVAASQKPWFDAKRNLPRQTVRRLRLAVYHHASPSKEPFLFPEEVRTIIEKSGLRFRRPATERGIRPETVRKALARVKSRFGRRQVPLDKLRNNGFRDEAYLFSRVLRGVDTEQLDGRMMERVRRTTTPPAFFGERELKTPRELLEIARNLYVRLVDDDRTFLTETAFKSTGNRKFWRQIRSLVTGKENAEPGDRKVIEEIEKLVHFQELPAHRARKAVRNLEWVYNAVNEKAEPEKGRKVTNRDLNAHLGKEAQATYRELRKAHVKATDALPFSEDQLKKIGEMMLFPGTRPKTPAAVHVTRINLIYRHFGGVRLGSKEFKEGARALGFKGISQTRRLVVAVLRGETDHPFTKRQVRIIKEKTALGQRG